MRRINGFESLPEFEPNLFKMKLQERLELNTLGRFPPQGLSEAWRGKAVVIETAVAASHWGGSVHHRLCKMRKIHLSHMLDFFNIK
jgi:hypothetical protein